MCLRRNPALVLLLLASGCGRDSPHGPAAPSPIVASPVPGNAALDRLDVDPAVLSGGREARGTATLTTAAQLGGVAVSLSASDASVSVPSSITVAAGATTAAVTVTTRAVTNDVPVTITGSAGGSSRSASLRLTPAPATLAGFELEQPSAGGGQAVKGRATLDGSPRGGTTIEFSSSHPSVTLPRSISVGDGVTAVTVPIQTNAVSSAINVTLSASQGGQRRTVALQVLPMFLTFTSSPGEFIGQGRSQRIEGPSARFSGDMLHGNRELQVNIDGEPFWHLRLVAPSGQSLGRGKYTVSRSGSSGTAVNFGGDGRGCTTETGDFEVYEAEYGPSQSANIFVSGTIRRFHATFSQRCNMPGFPLLTGEIRLAWIPHLRR